MARWLRNVRCMFLAIAVTACAGASSDPAVTLTIAHVNDSHSHLDSTGVKDASLQGTVGGLTRAATVLRRLRAEEPNLVALHAGDFFQGDLFFNAYLGVPELRALRDLGFDAVAVGNHEFGYGPELLALSLSQALPAADLPVLSANLDLSGYPALATWIKPSLLKEVGGITVGIFGMTTPDDATTFPHPARLLGAGDPAVIAAIAQEQAAALRSAGAQVVICLSHLGLALDRQVAASQADIDVIVGGHDHALLARPVEVRSPHGRDVLIVQAGEFYDHVGRLRLSIDRKGHVKLQSYALLAIDSSVPRDPAVSAAVDELAAGIVQSYGDVYGDVVGHSPDGVSAAYDPASRKRDVPVANLLTDAYRAKTESDLAMTTAGLISDDLPAGAVVAADVFRTVSYGLDPGTGLGLQLATFSIPGDVLLGALEVAIAAGGEDYLPQVSGMVYSFDENRPIGERLDLASVLVQGQPIDPARSYTVATNTGLLGALPLLGVEVQDATVLADFEYDVFREYLRSLPVVAAVPEGRILVDVTR